jgi:CheY-specific phosphatase CheX
MGARFFGQFLLERGVIDATGLLRALEYQSQRNLKIGVIAMREGLLSPADAERINAEQRRTDARFGDIALKLGLLTREKIDYLATLQQQSHIYIGQALVAVGALANETLQSELAAYQDEHDRERAASEKFARAINWANEPAVTLFVQMTSKLLMRMASILTKVGNAEVRVVLPRADIQVCLELRGGWNADALFGFSSDVAMKIASRMLGEPSPAPEMVADAVKEFTNVVAGHVCGSLASQELVCELSVVRLLAAYESAPTSASGILYVPLKPVQGTIELCVVPHDA